MPRCACLRVDVAAFLAFNSGAGCVANGCRPLTSAVECEEAAFATGLLAKTKLDAIADFMQSAAYAKGLDLIRDDPESSDYVNHINKVAIDGLIEKYSALDDDQDGSCRVPEGERTRYRTR